MRILSIGSDRFVLDPFSESAKRQTTYGTRFDAYDIIVFTCAFPRSEVALSAGVRAHATQSRSRLFYGIDAIRIARKLPKPDVVTAQDPFETGLVAWLIARMTGARLHVQVHTDFLSPSFTGVLNRIRTVCARFVLARADRIRVVSARIKNSLQATGYKLPAISVLPIFVDVTKFRGAHASVLAGRFAKFSVRLLVVARLEAEKGVDLALRAFAKSAPKDACLIVVGDGSESGALRKQAGKLGIMARTFFEGVADAAPYYAVADLVLVPSRYEGYGRVIIEALAAGKPVLSTDVGIAREAGALVADEAHFAEALNAWLKDGPREAKLQNYPYQSFDEYVRAYCEDLAAARRGAAGL